MAFCIFCDDIRMEVGNKPSFMGMYAADLVFPPNPPPDFQIFLPKFAIISWLFGDVSDKPTKVLVHVFGPPGKTEIIRYEVPYDPLTPLNSPFDDPTRFMLNIQIPLVNFPIACDGAIQVEIETERETIRAGRLRVRIPGRPDPTAGTGGAEAATSQTGPLEPSDQSASVARSSKKRPRRAAF
jgi:hypothetical protein